MVALPTRELKIGKIVDKTLGVLEINAVPALIYLLALTVITLPIAYASAGSTAPLQLLGGQLLRSVVGIVCGYFLLVTMVRRTGLQSRTGQDSFLSFFGMSVLATLAVMLGMIVFVLPGLFLMARWSVAQPLLVAQGEGALASLGESWERTRGNEFSIFFAAFAVLLLPIVVIIAASAFFEEGNLVRLVISEFATSAINLTLLSMGVALYGLLVGKGAAATPSV